MRFLAFPCLGFILCRMVRGSLEEEIWETPIMCLEELFFFNFSMSTRNLSAQGVGEGRGKDEDFFF